MAVLGVLSTFSTCDPFAGAVELDPTFAPAYVHAIQISFYLNDLVKVRRYLGRLPRALAERRRRGGGAAGGEVLMRPTRRRSPRC